MKKYCIKCGKEIYIKKENETLDKNDDSTVFYCKKCNNSLNNIDEVEELSIKELENHEYKQMVHNNITKSNSMRDNSLCFIVGGVILLIIGIFFLILSFKLTPIGERIFTPTSFEFIVCVISLIVSVSFLAYGIIRLTMALNRKKYFKKMLKK